MSLPRPKVLVGLLGLDAHEVGAMAVTGILRDAGMEVVYAGRFNTPARLARTATEEDVDVLGVSVHSWEFVRLIPELMDCLRETGHDVAVAVGGSVLTRADRDALAAVGVAATFGAGTTPEDIVREIAALAARRARA